MPRKPLHQPWTFETDQQLRSLWRKPLTLSAIARRMKRATGTIQLKASALGLRKRDSRAKAPAAAEPAQHSLVEVWSPRVEHGD